LVCNWKKINAGKQVRKERGRVPTVIAKTIAHVQWDNETKLNHRVPRCEAKKRGNTKKKKKKLKVGWGVTHTPQNKSNRVKSAVWKVWGLAAEAGSNNNAEI